MLHGEKIWYPSRLNKETTPTPATTNQSFQATPFCHKDSYLFSGFPLKNRKAPAVIGIKSKTNRKYRNGRRSVENFELRR